MHGRPYLLECASYVSIVWDLITWTESPSLTHSERVVIVRVTLQEQTPTRATIMAKIVNNRLISLFLPQRYCFLPRCANTIVFLRFFDFL